MDLIFNDLGLWVMVFAVAATLAAGFVKGAVGFAMPMIMISALGSVMAPETALAALIVPTLVANGWQAMRDGLAAALASARRFRFFLGIVLVFIVLSAQMVRVLPAWAMFMVLGVPVCLFAVAQLLGWQPRVRPEHRRRTEFLTGSFAGIVGGLSGVWGPPTVIYLNAIDTPKAEHLRVQGVVYGAGSVALFLAHVQSGVLNAHTAPLSLALLVPALAGMIVGRRVSDRLDQARFRRATLVVLVVAGLNLVRRGLGG